MITNPVKAIQVHCINCSGDSRAEVKLCPCTDCILYPFRLGKNPYRAKRELTEEQRKALSERMKKLHNKNNEN